MRTLRAFAIRLQGVLRRANDERDFAEQIEADLELHIEDAMRAGMTRDEATRAALLKFGGIGAAKEAWRDRHGVVGGEHAQQGRSRREFFQPCSGGGESDE